MIKHLAHITVMAIAVMFVAVALPSAQTGQMIERVRLEIERTDRILQEAQAHSSGSPIGTETLRRAEELQRQSRLLFDQGQYRMALELTLRVRDQVRASLMRGRIAEESDQVVLRRLERATELLDRVAAELPSDSDRGQRALYDAARENLQKAWELYRANRFRPAMKIIDQIEKNARKLLRQSDRQDRWNESFERKFRGTSDRLGEFEQRVDECESESAKTLLQQASHALELARKLADENNIAAAMQSLEDAHRFTQEGMRECFGPAVVELMIERMEKRLAMLDERIPDDDKRSRKILDQARRQIDLARDHVANNHPEEAAASLRAAQQSFQKLARIAKEYDI